MIDFDIIIPTYSRPDLLERTLKNISDAVRPAGLKTIYVVENGPKAGAQDVCATYELLLPLTYIYEQSPGLSNARNIGAMHATSPILLFIDDDIRVMAESLTSYNDAFQRHGATCFYGGPLLADYERPPEPFLIEFLPWSAKGHSLGDQEVIVDEALFLGGNIAIPREIFFRLGPFDEASATGSQGGGVGEETRLQKRMLAAGVPGIYVPGALVGHLVPVNRCDRAFVRRRSWRSGYGEGELSALGDKQVAKNCFGVPCWSLRKLAGACLSFIYALVSRRPSTDRFRKELSVLRQAGYIRGYQKTRRLRRQPDPAP